MYQQQQTSPTNNATDDDCPSLESGDMDKLTQEQFTKILTHECRYDKVVRPNVDGPLNVTVQIDLKHIEAVEQLVSQKFAVLLSCFQYYIYIKGKLLFPGLNFFSYVT